MPTVMPRYSTAVLVAVMLAACAPPGPPPSASQASPGEAPRAAVPKSMVVGLSAEPLTLGPFEVGGSPFMGPVYQMLHDFLVIHDDQGQAIAQLVAERPSIEKGTWRVNPDGTMESTWHL